ncbi:MAG: protein kinase [Rubripirellula sp.]
MAPHTTNQSETIFLAPSDSLLGPAFPNPDPVQKQDLTPAGQITITPDETSADDRFAETVNFLTVDADSNPEAAELGFLPIRQVAGVKTDGHDDTDYQLVGELGAGGTAIVFQAQQRAVNREVAVKTLRSELATKPSARERFLAEARVIGALDHPNVIALHEVYTDRDGSLSYSMKRIDGTSWDKQIADRSVSENVETLLRISDAIRYAHSRGIIHRDIKPENVMLGKFGEVLLADWGLAVHHGDLQATSALERSVGGTPAYMAPELASAAAGAITFQTDVYLLGAILYQIVTGHPPHQGQSLMQCILAATNNLIEPSDDDSELMEIAMRAMETKPADRYHDVEGFIAALHGHRQHEQAAMLIRRALKLVEQANGGGDKVVESEIYRNFGVADALLVEAIPMWPDNLKIGQIRKRLQLKHAAIAADHGDYDLAANLYEAAGESESDEAVMVQFHRLRRDASQMEASRYSVLFTLSPDPGLLIDMTTGTVFDANLAYGKMFGCMSEQLVGQRIEELKVWDTPETPKRLIQLARVEGEAYEFIAQFRHPRGHAIEVQLNSQLISLRGEPMLLSTIRAHS